MAGNSFTKIVVKCVLKKYIIIIYWFVTLYILLLLGIQNFPEIMFDFSQYLGFLAFLSILTLGFWLMIFLVHFVFYWIGGALFELYKEKKAEKALKQA